MASYFKVMKTKATSDTRFRSTHVTGDAAVEYEVGKMTVAPDWLAEEGYHPTVFATLQDAVNFVRSTDRVIYRAAVMGPVTDPLPFVSRWDLQSGRIVQSSRKWPNGTLMARGVIPMEEVPKSEWPART